MKTLMDAWKWYESARTNLVRMRRLGTRHWGDESLKNASIWLDDRFKEVEASDIERETDLAIKPLEDLGVLVLFSVFEATIRERVLAEVEAELPPLRHVAIKRALDEMREGIEHGSFFKVLEPYKDFDANLVEEVNQVRRYRNWVAHGRRTEQPAAVEPATAYDRLKRFLDHLSA